MLYKDFEKSFKKNYLGKILDTEELKSFYTHNKILSFCSEDIILKQGTLSQGIFIIIDGNVIVSAKLLGEGITNLETLGPGNFFGEISFIENGLSTTSSSAASKVKCLFVSNQYINMLNAYFPQTKYKLYTAISKQICERLKKMHDKIIMNISTADMITKSLLGEFIHSLTKPAEMTFEKENIDIDTLQKSQSFSVFNPEEIKVLLKQAILLKAPKNCTLIHKIEKNDSCYIVIHGAVQSSIMYENKVAKLSVIGPSTLFTSVNYIDKNFSSFTITFTTCEQAVLFKLPESNLLIIQKNNPILWYKLFDLICRSLVALEKSVDKLDIRLNIESYNR